MEIDIKRTVNVLHLQTPACHGQVRISHIYIYIYIGLYVPVHDRPEFVNVNIYVYIYIYIYMSYTNKTTAA